MELYFYWYGYKEPFKSKEARLEILKRLNEIEGVDLADDAIEKRPTISLSLFEKPDRMRQLQDTSEWMIEEIQNT